jgi:hypothetical protein
MKKSMKTKIALLKGRRAELLMKARILCSAMEGVKDEFGYPIEAYLQAISHAIMGLRDYFDTFSEAVERGMGVVKDHVKDMFGDAAPDVIARATNLAMQIVRDWVVLQYELLVLAKRAEIRSLPTAFGTLEEFLGFSLKDSDFSG